MYFSPGFAGLTMVCELCVVKIMCTVRGLFD